MKKLILLALACLLLAIILPVFYLSRTTSIASAKISEEQILRIRDQYEPRREYVSPQVQADLSKAYGEIACAYTNNDVKALKVAIEKLPKINDYLSWEVGPRVESPLAGAFDAEFLRTDHLKSFRDCAELERYLRVNLEVAMFYGKLYGRRKSFVAMSMIEPLTYRRLQAYKEKFAEGGHHNDMESVVQKFIEEWIGQIESQSGFTRVAARQIILMNTQHTEAICPGRGLPKEKARLMGRNIAESLVRCGYTPKWLKEYEDSNVDQVSE